MKKKIELAADFFKKNHDIFICPICKTELDIVDNQNAIFCKFGHTFNISKKGTIQLVNKYIKSDYDEKLFTSRSLMMKSGLFTEVFDRINSEISANSVVVDAGSGEGSALIDLRAKKDILGLGFDLSSEGVAASSRGLALENILFAVSNLANIPLKNRSVDYIINLLSPASYEEFQRILKKEGLLLKIVPNSQYLTEIRQFAAKKQEHIKSTYDNSDVLDNLRSQVKDIEVENIN